MSVAVSQHKNFVGGKWVDAIEGGTMEVLNPATGETIAEVPERDAGRRRPRRRGGQDRAARVARDHSGRARRGAAQARRRDRGQRRGARRAGVAERRQAALVCPRRDARLGGQPALLRGRGARARGQVGRRVHARLHLDDPPRAGRHRRRDRALELPADDGRLEDRPCARSRQRADRQAVRADAALDAALRRAGRGDPPAGRAQCDHRRRRARRRGDRAPPGRAHGLADR